MEEMIHVKKDLRNGVTIAGENYKITCVLLHVKDLLHKIKRKIL